MKKKVVVLLFVFLCTYGYGVEYSLKEMLVLAESNSLELKGLDAMADAMKSQADMEGADWMDTMFSYGVMDLKYGAEGYDSKMLQHKLSVKQTIPVSGRLRWQGMSVRSAYSNVLLEGQMKRLEIRQMLQENAVEYRLNLEILRNFTEEISLLGRMLELAKVRYTTGDVLLASLIEVQVKIAEASNMLLMTLSMQTQIGSSVAEILALDPSDFQMNLDKISVRQIWTNEVNPEELYRKAIDFNPLLRSAENTVVKNRDLKSLAVAEWIPDVGVMAEYGYTPSVSPEHTVGVYAELNLPLFSSVSKAKKLRMAEFQVKQSEAELAAGKNSLKALLTRKCSELHFLKIQSDLLENHIIRLSENNITSLLTAYQVGKTDLDTVLNAMMTIYNLRNNYYTGIARIDKILLELESLTGECFLELESGK